MIVHYIVVHYSIWGETLGEGARRESCPRGGCSGGREGGVERDGGMTLFTCLGSSFTWFFV